MYYNDVVVVCNNGDLKSYTVTNTKNEFNGYVEPKRIHFYSKNEDGWYEPVKERTEYVIRKETSKPSIYKRRFLACKADEYKYAFTEKTTKTTVKERDVYYNEDRDRFITKTKTSYNTKVEYGLPRLIIW